MTYILTILLFLISAVVEAQTVTVAADRFRLNTGPCVNSSGTGSPNSVVTGSPCDTWHQTDSPYLVWHKTSGTGTTTGWTADLVIPAPGLTGTFLRSDGTSVWTTSMLQLPNGAATGDLLMATSSDYIDVLSADPTPGSPINNRHLQSHGPSAVLSWTTFSWFDTLTATNGHFVRLRDTGNPNVYESTLILPDAAAVGDVIVATASNTWGSDADLTFTSGTTLNATIFNTSSITDSGLTGVNNSVVMATTGGVLAKDSDLTFTGGNTLNTVNLVSTNITQTGLIGVATPSVVLATNGTGVFINDDELTFSGGNTLVVGKIGTPATGSILTSLITSHVASNLSINSTQNILVNPAGKSILPLSSYDISLGSDLAKFKEGYFAELHISTIVAQDVISTIGGHVIVAPTTSLTADLAPATTTIAVKHKNLATNDIVFMEGAPNGGVPQFEAMVITGATGGTLSGTLTTVTGVNAIAATVIALSSSGASGTLVSGDVIKFSPASPYSYIVASSVGGSTPTSVTITTGLLAATAGGEVVTITYRYTVTRNFDAGTANQWYVGDAVMNTGQTGNGYIDLYSTIGLLNIGTGPTIVGNVRTGTAAHTDIAPRWAIGNLNGLYGYGATTFGTAFGNPSGTNMTIDATNGIRIRNTTTNLLTADATGVYLAPTTGGAWSNLTSYRFNVPTGTLGMAGLDASGGRGLRIESKWTGASTRSQSIAITADDGTAASAGVAQLVMNSNTVGDFTFTGATAIFSDISAIHLTVADNLLQQSGTVPVFQILDTTASAKDLTLQVNADIASFYESAGAAGDILSLDLANNRVGIGTATPAAKLDIIQAGGAGLLVRYNAVSPTFQISPGSSAVALPWIGTNIVQNPTTDTQTYARASYATRIYFPEATTGTAVMRMETSAIGSAGGAITWIDGLALSATGYVGIGTTSPTTPLMVVNSLSSGTISTYTTMSGKGIALNPNLTAGIVDIYSDFLGGTEPKLHLSTFTNRSNAGGVTIDIAGLVGVNKLAPTTALDVAGTVTATLFAGSGASLTALPAGNLTGTVVDARLSANVPLLNAANVFSSATGQRVTKLGIGVAPTRLLDINGGTTGVARFAYDTGHYLDFTVSVDGTTNILQVGDAGSGMLFSNYNGATSGFLFSSVVTTGKMFNLSTGFLTTGDGLYVGGGGGDPITSGQLVNLQISGTTGLTGQAALNILLAGANTTGAQTTYGAKVSNTHSGTSVNVAGSFSASGGSSNYGLLVPSGNVGIGENPAIGVLQIVQTSTSAYATYIRRNLTSTSTDSPMVYIRQQHASDDQPSLYLDDAGTGGAIYVNTGNTYLFPLKSTTGVRYVCVDTAGKLVSQAAACSGT